MRITYLVEVADQIWGGVKVILEDANWLADQGHEVRVLSRSGPPPWMQLRCGFSTVPDFTPENIPPSDIVVGTFWTTVPAAAAAGRAGLGVPVHYCQGYEGDNPENAGRQHEIEAVYRLDEVRKITISGHLSHTLKEQFGCESREIVYAVDHDAMWPGPQRPNSGQVRVGLVGPYEIAWKDIATGLEACALARQAGLDLQVVRVTNTLPHADENRLPFPVEWHERVPPAAMGDVYRTLDVFLGTSRGKEEGFFLPAVEAMACGVPCVLTDIPCFRGYGDGQYALFAEPRNPHQMAEALVLAARHPHVRDALRGNGIQVAARYRADAHGSELEQAFGEFCRASRPAVEVAPASAEQLETADGMALATGMEDELDQLAGALTRTLRSSSEILHAQGDYRRAAEHLEAALLVDRENPTLQQELAHALYLAGDDAEALRRYDALLAAGHHDADLLASRGLVLFSMGDHATAAEAFRAAIGAGAEDAETHNNLGVALFQSGSQEAAIAEFECALALDPDHADAAFNLSSVGSPSAP